jgi:hypothetical protein
MSAYHHFVKELAVAAANVAQTNKIIAEQRRRSHELGAGAATQVTRKRSSKRCWTCGLTIRTFTINPSSRYSLRQRVRPWPTSSTIHR